MPLNKTREILGGLGIHFTKISLWVKKYLVFFIRSDFELMLKCSCVESQAWLKIKNNNDQLLLYISSIWEKGKKLK